LTDLPFFYFHVFTYSDRPGTPSWDLKPKVPHQVKKARTRNLIELSERKRRAFYAAHIGQSVSVLFETQEDGYWTGYTDNYMRVHVKSERALTNQIDSVQLSSLEHDRLVALPTASEALIVA